MIVSGAAMIVAALGFILTRGRSRPPGLGTALLLVVSLVAGFVLLVAAVTG